MTHFYSIIILIYLTLFTHLLVYIIVITLCLIKKPFKKYYLLFYVLYLLIISIYIHNLVIVFNCDYHYYNFNVSYQLCQENQSYY